MTELEKAYTLGYLDSLKDNGHILIDVPYIELRPEFLDLIIRKGKVRTVPQICLELNKYLGRKAKRHVDNHPKTVSNAV